MHIPEPTNEQCSSNSVVCEDDTKIGYAIWYPQMGGYVGRAVVVLDKEWSDNGSSRSGGCFDVLVWHDGDFPFSNGLTPPIELHHCDPEQFIEFGRAVARLNAAGRRTPDDQA